MNAGGVEGLMSTKFIQQFANTKKEYWPSIIEECGFLEEVGSLLLNYSAT